MAECCCVTSSNDWLEYEVKIAIELGDKSYFSKEMNDFLRREITYIHIRKNTLLKYCLKHEQTDLFFYFLNDVRWIPYMKPLLTKDLLFTAIEKGNTIVCEYLIKFFNEVKYPLPILKKSGKNLLHHLCKSSAESYREIFTLLMKQPGMEAPEIWTDKKGNSPLHQTAKVGNYEFFKMLVMEQKHSPLIKNKNGKTPFDKIGICIKRENKNKKASEVAKLRFFASKYMSMNAFWECAQEDYNGKNPVAKLSQELLEQIDRLVLSNP